MLKVFENINELVGSIAAEIRDEMSILSPSELFTVGFPTGRSCAQVLTKLATLREVDLNKLKIVFLDAYCVREGCSFHIVDGEANPLSFVRRLLKGVPGGESILEAANFIIPNPNKCAEFEKQLRDSGVNLMLLASGSGDGHVAFNSPGTDRLTITRVAKLASSTRRDNLKTYKFWKFEEDVPEYGVTIGIDTITTCSESSIMVLAGEDKHLALKKVLAAERYCTNWPSTVIHECVGGRIYTDTSTLQLSKSSSHE